MVECTGLGCEQKQTVRERGELARVNRRILAWCPMLSHRAAVLAKRVEIWGTWVAKSCYFPP